MTEEKTEYAVTTVATSLPAPVVTLKEWATRRQQFNEFVNTQLRDKIDFGVVPGTDKKTLLKPGAEKILQLYGVSVILDTTERQQDQTTGYLYVEYTAKGANIQTGSIVGYGVGACSSYESKYRWRWEWWNGRNDPATSDGWEKFTKKNGQTAWRRRMENRDLIDVWNTVIKMAKKRAMVDLALTISGASEKFTQDVEDFIEAEFTEASDDKATKQQPVRAAQEPTQSPAQPAQPVQAPAPAHTNGKRPWEPAAVRENILKAEAQEHNEGPADNGFRGLTIGAIEAALGGGVNAQQGRHLITEYVFGEKSSLKLNAGQIAALNRYVNSGPYVKVELAAIVAQQLKASGQEPLM